MFFSRHMRSLRLARQQMKNQITSIELIKAKQTLLPSWYLPVSIIREGGNWVCSFECHEDPLKCVTAYGSSPLQATINFDNLWTGIGEFLPELGEDDDDDEEEF